MSPARKSSVVRTRQNWGTTANALAATNALRISARRIRIGWTFQDVLDLRLDFEINLDRSVDDVAERTAEMLRSMIANGRLRAVGRGGGGGRAPALRQLRQVNTRG